MAEDTAWLPCPKNRCVVTAPWPQGSWWQISCLSAGKKKVNKKAYPKVLWFPHPISGEHVEVEGEPGQHILENRWKWNKLSFNGTMYIL